MESAPMTMDVRVIDVLLCALAILLGALVHWRVRRLARRLPLALARRAGASAAPGVASGRLAWQRTIRLGAPLVNMGIWLVVACFVTRRLAPLAEWRRAATMVLSMGLAAPVVTINQRSYSTSDLVALPALLVAVWLVATAASRLVRYQVLRSAGVERGVEEFLAVLLRYSLALVGSIVVLQAWGIDLSTLTIFASVLGVGIGFGLQNIANNFVSGVLISLERPIQPGDFVDVGSFSGTVERIGARSTEIRTVDQVSILIPNARLLESEVVNWSHGDPVCRIHVPVGVSYSADLAKARAALLDAAHTHPSVLDEPPAKVSFKAFGDSALELELLVWTREPRLQTTLKSDLNFRILTNLRRQGVEIPFPQRDLHLRSAHLDALLAAWGRTSFPDVDLGALAENAAGRANGVADAAEPEIELGFRLWSDAELEALVGRLRAPGGVAIQDRRHLLTTYARCFVGREAVEWLARNEGLTEQEAIGVGQLLVDRRIAHHVLDEHAFKNGNFFYRFYADERAVPGAMDLSS